MSGKKFLKRTMFRRFDQSGPHQAHPEQSQGVVVFLRRAMM